MNFREHASTVDGVLQGAPEYFLHRISYLCHEIRHNQLHKRNEVLARDLQVHLENFLMDLDGTNLMRVCQLLSGNREEPIEVSEVGIKCGGQHQWADVRNLLQGA